MQTSPGWLPQGNEITSGDALPKPHPVTAGAACAKVLCCSFFCSGCEMEELRGGRGLWMSQSNTQITRGSLEEEVNRSILIDL